MRIAIYARKSRLSDKGDSIENQIDICKNYISNKYTDENIDLEVFSDDGYTGSNTKRPNFQSLLSGIKANKYDILICYRLDRISRNLSDFSNTYDLLQKHNVEFISVKEAFDTSTPIGRAMLNIAMVFSQLERETIRERIMDNLLALSKSGKWLGGTPPLGYISSKQVYLDGTRQKNFHILELDTEFAPVVKLLYTKFLELGSLSKTVKFLNSSRVTNRNGKPFNRDKLTRILSNPTYCPADEQAYNYFTSLGCNVTFDLCDCSNKSGILPFNRTIPSGESVNSDSSISKNSRIKPYSEWIIAQSYHTPIVTSAQWIQTQELIKLCQERDFKKGNGKISNIALLGDLLYCKHCGSKMLVTNQSVLADGSISYIYRCQTKHKSNCKDCNVENARGHLLDPYLLEYLQGLYMDKGTLISMLQSQRESLFNNAISQLNVTENLERQLNDITDRINNLVDTLSKTSSSQVQETLLTKIDNLTIEKTALQLQLEEVAEMSHSASHSLDQISDIVERLSNMYNCINDASLTEKRLLLSALIDKIEWDGSNVDIILRTHKSPSQLNRNLVMESKISYA